MTRPSRPAFASADRGVSELVGFLVVVTLVVLSVAMVQVTAVPAWNQDVERQHSADVRSDAIDLRGAVVDTAGFGNQRSAALELGTGYPGRLLFVNPPPATGRLETTQTEDLVLRNVAAVGHENTRAYWNRSDAHALPTSRLTYEASYNQYQSAPTTVLEHGVLAQRYPTGGERIRGAQPVVDGNRITLVALTGALSESGVREATVETRPTSAPARRLAVTGSTPGEPVVLELPTDLSEGTWDELLADELRSENPQGNVLDYSVDAGTLRLELDGSERYELRLAQVGLTDATARQQPAYVVTDGPQTVAPGEEFVVVVRDRFNNPVPNAAVEVQGAAECAAVDAQATTDEAGRIVANCAQPANLTFAVGPEPYESVDVRVGRSARFDTEAPTIDAVSTSPETETFNVTSTTGERTLSQVTVSYTASDDRSGVERVVLSVRNETGAEVTATTHTFDAEDFAGGTVEGQWVTPWLDANGGAVRQYTVRVRVVDRGGNRAPPEADCSVPVPGSGCS